MRNFHRVKDLIESLDKGHKIVCTSQIDGKMKILIDRDPETGLYYLNISYFDGFDYVHRNALFVQRVSRRQLNVSEIVFTGIKLSGVITWKTIIENFQIEIEES